MSRSSINPIDIAIARRTIVPLLVHGSKDTTRIALAATPSTTTTTTPTTTTTTSTTTTTTTTKLTSTEFIPLISTAWPPPLANIIHTNAFVNTDSSSSINTDSDCNDILETSVEMPSITRVKKRMGKAVCGGTRDPHMRLQARIATRNAETIVKEVSNLVGPKGTTHALNAMVGAVNDVAKHALRRRAAAKRATQNTSVLMRTMCDGHPLSQTQNNVINRSCEIATTITAQLLVDMMELREARLARVRLRGDRSARVSRAINACDVLRVASQRATMRGSSQQHPNVPFNVDIRPSSGTPSQSIDHVAIAAAVHNTAQRMTMLLRRTDPRRSPQTSNEDDERLSH